MFFNYEKQTKKVSLTAAAMLSGIVAFEQGNGFISTTQLSLFYAIGAVVGLIVGVKVYNKFSSGDPDTLKVLAVPSMVTLAIARALPFSSSFYFR